MIPTSQIKKRQLKYSLLPKQKKLANVKTFSIREELPLIDFLEAQSR